MNAEYVFEIILLILKIIIISLWIIDIYLQYAPAEYRFLDINNEQFLKKRTVVFFELSIAFLIIYLFNPFHSHKISKLTKFTLFMFGVLIIVRTDWFKFIGESILIKYL